MATTTYVLAMGFRPPRGDATDAARADDMELVWLDPATGSEVHVAELRHLVPIGSPPQLPAPRLTTCPAVGPTEEERGSEDPIRNMVFTGLHISASPPLYLPEVNLRAFLVDPAGTYAGSLEKGRNWGSPVLHENGDGIYPDDGTEVNSFDNLLTDPISSRWSPLSDTYVFSCSAGVFPDRTAVFWREASGLLRGVEDPISGSPTGLLGNVGTVPAAIGGAPALDKFGRWFVISDVNGKVSARLKSYDADLDFFKAWAVPQPPGTIPPVTFPPYTPPIINFTNDLAQPADPGMAIDEDGTLICANEGYIFAIRPLPGDFDGDGCRTYFDIDAFVLALLGPIPPATLTWEQTYGATLGVNLLGIGDLNNDGFFGNADIDGFVALMVDHLGCPDGTDDPMSFDCSAEEELFGESFSMSAGGDDAAGLSDREIAIQRLTPLYDYFGMLPPW